MFRHFFIGVIKEGVSNEKINERISELETLADFPKVVDINVGRNLRWYMPTDAIILTAVFSSKEDWMAFVNSEVHQHLNAVASEVFDLDKSTGYQIEI